jgi:hypothetical protein
VSNLTQLTADAVTPARAGKLYAGIGTSRSDDATHAGRGAAEAAVARLGGVPPALVLVLTSVRYDLADLLAGVRQVTGEAPLVGSTSSGQFHEGELTPPGTGVVVLALAGDRYRFGVASSSGVRADSFAAGQHLARAARAAAGGHRSAHAALMVLVDGLAGAQQTLLNGIYRVTGAPVPVIGGAAADDRRLTETFVFEGDRVLTDAAVGVWIDSDRPLTVVREHGWQPVGLPMLVTRVDDTIVHEIAGRPAREVFEEHFRHDGPLHQMVWQMPGGYYSAGAFGLIEPDGSLLIRGAFIDGDGVIRTFTPLPAYCAVHLVSSKQDDLLDVGDRVVARALAGAADPAVLLGFSCVARLDVLLDRGHEEAARLQAAAGPVPTVGFYTYGEYARTTGVAGYHNATIAAIAL